MGFREWWTKRRLYGLKRRLAAVEAAIAQEKRYEPTVYPIVMGALVSERAALQFDIEEIEGTK